MDDFLKENYLLLTHSVELIAAVTGLVLYTKYKLTAAKYFILFLVYLTVCDFIGGYTWHVHEKGFLKFLVGTIIEKNFWWGTSYWTIGAILFFSFYYHKILQKKLSKIIIKFGAIAYLIFSITYIAFSGNAFFNKLFPVLGVLGAIIIFICTVFYFIEILQSDRVLTFYKSLNFYISVVIFIWWLITTPLEFYDVYFTYEVGDVSTLDLNFRILRWKIYLLSNIMMYSIFTFALIFCKPEKEYIVN